MSEITQHIYREKTFHLKAMGWMAEHWGYEEIFSDEEATGARMDSVGILRGQVVAIEVKLTLPTSLVFHESRRGGTIESKIAETLHKLYKRKSGKLTQIIDERWDGTPLTIVLVVETIGAEATELLSKMLRRRSLDWCFNYLVLTCRGQGLEAILQGPQVAVAKDLSKLDIPILSTPSFRRKAKSLKELIERCGKGEMESLLVEFVELARSNGFKAKLEANCVGLSLPGLNADRLVLTIFVNSATLAHGFNVGIGADRLELDDDMLPGRLAPREGYLNTNRHIRVREDFLALLEIVRSKRVT